MEPVHATSDRAPVRPAGIRSCLARGAGTIAARPGLVALAVLAVAVAQAPQFLVQARSEALLARSQEAMGGRDPSSMSPDEAVAQIGTLLGACGWNCLGLAYGLLVVLPAVAGACVAVAGATSGAGRVRDLGCAFGRRYGAVAVTGLVTGVIGGGAVMLVAIVATAGGLVRANEFVSGIIGPDVARALLAAVGVVTAWLTARLWFALPRAADPRRPRLPGVACVLQSWTATEGVAQWRVLALLAASGASIVACMLPGTALLGRVPDRGIPLAWAVTGLGACVGAAFGLSVLGAAYESLMPASGEGPVARESEP